MLKRPITILAAIAIPLVVISGINATAASADPAPSNSKLPEGIWVAPDVDLSKPTVHSDGPNSLAACGPYDGAGLPTGWRTYQWTDCSYIGSTASATKGYAWNSPNWSAAEGCGQGMGYRSGSPYWIGLGCGKSGRGTADWGNVIGVPKFQSIGITPPSITPITWS
ncbi:hypothetical protein [Microtetraspora malaysiensis]|uniref:Secreted protein n=1 Tax=Microtetraspora malaysiensis TaxID=161358 RepID=A0ABW6T532_9ACTN